MRQKKKFGISYVAHFPTYHYKYHYESLYAHFETKLRGDLCESDS